MSSLYASATHQISRVSRNSPAKKPINFKNPKLFKHLLMKFYRANFQKSSLAHGHNSSVKRPLAQDSRAQIFIFFHRQSRSRFIVINEIPRKQSPNRRSRLDRKMELISFGRRFRK
jgi:hypothetical protein